MDYKAKIKHAEQVAEEMEQRIDQESIRKRLSDAGMYETDINNIMVSAKKVLGEKYQDRIKANLLEGKPIRGAEEFSLLEEDVLDGIVQRVAGTLATEEKKKIAAGIKAGRSVQDVLAKADLRFLPAESAAAYAHNVHEVKKQNSGSGRMFNILGGIGLILLTGILMVTINRLFYFLPIIGLVMIVKGVTTAKMD